MTYGQARRRGRVSLVLLWFCWWDCFSKTTLKCFRVLIRAKFFRHFFEAFVLILWIFGRGFLLRHC